ENKFYATCPQCKYKVKITDPNEPPKPRAPKPENHTQLKGVAAIISKFLAEYNYDKESLIQILLKIQEKYGWLPQEMLTEVSRQLEIPYNRVYQVVTFYKAFSLAPKGKHIIKVCMGTSCMVRGSQVILDGITRKLGIEIEETTDDGLFTLETVNCVGCCALGPLVTIDEKYYGNLKLQDLDGILEKYK
ncbi:NADH-quinone oxidoreductase subunit NuoE, partial [Candidatus Bathyarchaeota archaeon]|nr:NADH-quinone oxidoreductase subunit NuoE [Candidatus Bathyarchaeota archaeon]